MSQASPRHLASSVGDVEAPDAESSTEATGPHPMRPATTPVGPGAISAVGMVLAALVTAVGVVATRDSLVAAGVLGGSLWLEAAVAPLDGLATAGWAVPVGLVLVGIGLWLLLAALRPRPRTAIAVQAQTGVFLRPRGVQRLAVTAAEHVDGVLTAKASTGRRQVSVTATTTGDEGIGDRIREAVTDRLAPLASPPAVRVRTITEGGGR